MSARPAARTGDLHACPDMEPGPAPHVGGPVVEGSSNTFINGRPAARAGDPTACAGPPGQIEAGSSGVYINRQAAARIADRAGHDGRVADGSSNVHIGDHGRRTTGRATGPGQAMAGQLAFVLHADYDRSGSVDASEHRRRLMRPGAILLPNLDIDDGSRLATSGARVPGLDAYQELAPAADDDLSTGFVERSPYDPVRATRAELVLHPADAARVRIFASRSRPAILGVQTVMNGPRDYTGTVHRYAITAPVGVSLEAIAPAGDPSRPAPGGSAPPPPSRAFAHDAPPRRRGRLYGQRAPGEVWIEVEHTGGGATHRDVSLFTIAPFLLVPNTQPVEMLYVVYTGDRRDDSHPTVVDTLVACRQIFGSSAVDVPPSAGDPVVPHTPVVPGAPSLQGKKVHVIRSHDAWIQDQVVFGYCEAPQRTLQVAVNCKRSDSDDFLRERVREDFPSGGLAFYDGLLGPGSSIDYGGNIEVSPPIDVQTDRMARDAAGPTVARHPPAPLGKIIFGDCHPREAHRETREFLLAQRVQPVLPIDTSWLVVGHVDEIMITVPDRRAGGFKLLVSSAEAMTKLLRGAQEVARPTRTGLHRGKQSRAPTYFNLELEVEHLLDTPIDRLPNSAIVRWSAADPPVSSTVREYNERLQQLKLLPITERLRNGLGLTDADVLPIPVYFRVPTKFSEREINHRDRGHRTASLTVDCVNLQVVNDHLLVPRPFGPRVPPADAQRILRRVLSELSLGHLQVRLGPTDTIHWSYPGEADWKIFAYFARLDPARRAHVLGRVDRDDYNGLSAIDRPALEQARAALASRNAQHFPTGAAWTSTSNQYRRLELDEGTVDLVESYLETVLAPLGLTVHFVDTWFYHVRTGAVHCGTNARLTPPSVHWWDHYDPVGPHWRYRPDR